MIKNNPITSLTLWFLLLLNFSVMAQNQLVPSPPAISAESYVLMDYHSNRILMQKNPHAKVDPASITKMMTAYVVFKEIKNGQLSLQGSATISEKAWRTGGSKMFIEVDKQVNIEDLVRGMIVQSGNDASIALAEHIAGSEEVFASMMNKAAANLGMKNSHFTNATGLPEEDHYMSAYDVALLGQALVREFPDLYHIYSEKEFTYNGIKQHNRNTLLWRDPTVDGFKTGHTESAGYCLATTSSRNGMRLLNVVMGTESEKARADETQKMLNYGFRFFETHKLYPAGQQQAVAEVWKGQAEEVSLGLADDLFITIPKGSYERLQAGVDIPGRLQAPITQGQILGNLTIRLDDTVVIERPMVALKDVQQGGWWTRMVDGMGLWFKSFGDDD
ncbi:MAG: D-alanyl-D-alanine carboxypeptidase [Proteobacteria bacterium]|nr:MAG: D-alanyl-D-alanine carboxypeptidase [Pseudomonadota bacterium]